MLLNPKTATFTHLDPRSREIMQKTIAFFENKGKQQCKADYHGRVWYTDFLEFMKENRIFATLLTPAEYGGGDPDVRWDTRRICDFNEILAFYGLGYWYTWQVSILGLGPIWMSKNEALKRKTAQLLRDGAIFAFGLSEKAHGADLYASEMSLTPLGEGRYVADGGKYYIGNANEAALVSTFGIDSETDEFVFFTAEPPHPNYELVKNIVEWQSYVAEYALSGYPVAETDLLSRGPDAWDAALNTVNVGKYNLGWASIGICTHAFYEAINHAAHRRLYKKQVTQFPHIRQLFNEAYVRLLAMRLFALRASDYMRCASREDRRYLLYNPLVKMKVTTEGEAVINRLWDVIAAKGFEKDVYFENAAHDIRSLPKLEGTVHVNMALVVKFMANYFFNPGQFAEVPERCDPADDTFLFNQGPAKGLGKIRFHDYRKTYGRVELSNVRIFREQIDQLKAMLATASPDKTQSRDIDFLLGLGELFTLVVYGQLIIEQALSADLKEDLLNHLFGIFVDDFSQFALQLYRKPSVTTAQMACCLKMIKKAAATLDGTERIFGTYVEPLTDTYEMNP